MSIQSEIDRIAGAKPILGNYLQQNGVAVPSGATLDEMALLLADVIGTKSQEKIVNLSMASGNQVITPDDGYTLSKVTVTKPDTLIPDNIKKDVNIGGVVGSMSGGGAPSLQSKSVTYTANGTATITPDEGYDGLSSVDVTVNVASGGGGGAGFSVTFPATAKNWGAADPNNAYILLADGTFKSIKDYSTIGGKTIENVAGIVVRTSDPFYIFRMTLSAGGIAQFSVSEGTSSSGVTTAPNTTTSRYDLARSMLWWPVADTVISSIEIYSAE